jgi:hypothetical protein
MKVTTAALSHTARLSRRKFTCSSSHLDIIEDIGKGRSRI